MLSEAKHPYGRTIVVAIGIPRCARNDRVEAVDDANRSAAGT
jgi:hypothetical protein